MDERDMVKRVLEDSGDISFLKGHISEEIIQEVLTKEYETKFKGYTMLEVAHKLNITKELVKYYRKKLPEEELRKINGIVYISESGLQRIKANLTKANYSTSFEEKVLDQLNHIKFVVENLALKNFDKL